MLQWNQPAAGFPTSEWMLAALIVGSAEGRDRRTATESTVHRSGAREGTNRVRHTAAKRAKRVPFMFHSPPFAQSVVKKWLIVAQRGDPVNL